MRPLTDEETKVFFEKLSKYIGENVKLLIDRPDGGYCFRLHKDRVYYCSAKIVYDENRFDDMRESIRYMLNFLEWENGGMLAESNSVVKSSDESEELMKRATCIARENLMSFGTCFGKFTKSGKFRLHITALDYLAPYAKYKIWLKPGAEQQFVYGHHIMKNGLGRITENTSQYQGVIVLSMNDMPLGFGVAAKSTQECRHSDPMTIVAFHQADIGEYIRSEETLT